MADVVDGEAQGAGVGEVLELLLTSPRRWDTLRATVASWTPRSKVLNRVWLAAGGRVRTETSRSGGDPVTTVTIDGKQWWALDPAEGVTIGDEDPPPVPWALSAAIDEFLGRLGCFDLVVTGPTTHAGRPCLRLQATRRPAPGWCPTPENLPDKYEVAVDRELGVIMRLEARTGGSVSLLDEVADLVAGEAFPDSVFAGPPPGHDEDTRGSRQRLHERFLTLADAAASAPFTVLVPGRLPDDGHLQPVFVGRRWNDSAVSAILTYNMTPPRHLTLHETGADPVGVALADTNGWERIEHDGSDVYIAGPSGPSFGSSWRALTERDGTRVLLSLAGEYGREDLLGVVDSLVPAVPTVGKVDP